MKNNKIFSLFFATCSLVTCAASVAAISARAGLAHQPAFGEVEHFRETRSSSPTLDSIAFDEGIRIECAVSTPYFGWFPFVFNTCPWPSSIHLYPFYVCDGVSGSPYSDGRWEIDTNAYGASSGGNSLEDFDDLYMDCDDNECNPPL